ncbi:Clavaminate synthase-like protein [Ramaria rubella]|nr:Clavaminate synthase-like protein [Ramaria rubella]
MPSALTSPPPSSAEIHTSMISKKEHTSPTTTFTPNPNKFPVRRLPSDPDNFRRSVNTGQDGKPLGTAPAATVQDGQYPPWINIWLKVDRIVEIISRYLSMSSSSDQFQVTGRKALTKLVSRYVETDETMVFVIPSFPFKSPSRKKVLGSLPDLGEELLLRKLETLARAVEDYHPPGALIRVVSDGIVYGELLEQSDTIVYRYNNELRRMCNEFSLTHISFVRVIDLLDDTPLSNTPMSEEEYVKSIPAVRARFLAHEVSGFHLETLLKDDFGTLMTYRGYLKFLVQDVEGSPLMKDLRGKPLSKNAQDKARRSLAKAMLENGAKFSDLVRLKFPDAIRLSIHAHNNTGPKYAFQMPGGDMCGSPWHNVVKEELDGKLTMAQLHTFESSSYDIVHRYGRPYYLRARSPDHDLGDRINPHVTFIHNYPFGMVVKVDPAANLSLDDLPMKNVRALALRYSVLLFRGFVESDRECFRRMAKGLGEVVPWPKYGDILELKENPNLDINSSLTREAMPMHYDGVFMTKKDENGELTHNPPTFQVFRCIRAPEQAEGGKTLITNTADLICHGLTASQRDWLSGKKYSVFTPANKVFGGELLTLPIIMRNENTGHDVLRWHEPWPQYITKYKPTEVSVNGVVPEDSISASEHITDLLYDRRFCYAHTWTTGDLLIADNIELMHTRTAFNPCPRELWRIHVN